MTKQEQYKHEFYNIFRQGDLSDEGKANLDKLLELQKPRTNFDRITESEEALANVLVQFDFEYDEYNVYGTYDACDSREEAIKLQIEWLQKECENG